MKAKLFLLIISLLLLLPSVSLASCINPVKEKKLLSMSYDAFDQKQDGWRQYAKPGCYHETGILIDKYLHKNKGTLADWQLNALTWHAGQMYAFNHEYKIAKIRFKQAININEPSNAPLRWNDYVYATLAFLDNDMSKLKFYRNKIANGPAFNGTKPNLDVVDSFIRCFGKPYSVAYHAIKTQDHKKC